MSAEGNPLITPEVNQEYYQPQYPVPQYQQQYYQQPPQQPYNPQQQYQQYQQPYYQPQQIQQVQIQQPNVDKEDDQDVIQSLLFFILGFFCCCIWYIPMKKFKKHENETVRLFTLLSKIFFIIYSCIYIGSFAFCIFYFVVIVLLVTIAPTEEETN